RVQQAREAKLADLKVLAEQIQRVPHLTIEANANVEGHLYGSVGAQDISRTLKGKNVKVEPDMVQLEGVIKVCGLYDVKLNLGNDIGAQVQVMVVPAKTEEKKYLRGPPRGKSKIRRSKSEIPRSHRRLWDFGF